jgi:transposase
VVLFRICKASRSLAALGATMVLSVIGNFDDFQHPEQLVAYFGLAPTVRHSKLPQ